MADSENSRTLPSITRRNLLLTTSGLLKAKAGGAGQTASARTVDSPGAAGIDPTLDLWQQWSAAHRCREELCNRQQKLETKLLQSVSGFPQVELKAPGKPGSVFARSMTEIDRLLPGPEMAELRCRAKTDFSERRRAWKAADAQIGYTLACRAETEASNKEAALSDLLWNTPAQSTAGAIAKLHAVIEMEDPGGRLQEKPWPQLRAILADLLRIESPPPPI